MNEWLEAEQRIERAWQLFASQRWEEALAEIEVALSINPTNAAWHAQRGFILEELDRCADAATAYERALELNPQDREVAVALGGVLSHMGRFGRALEVFEELARLYPDFEPAYCHRIYVYAELGRHDQAEEMFYLAQELDECCPHCFFHMGASLAAVGQTDRAIYCWQRVLELDPDYIGVNRRIAQAYRAQGQDDWARDHFLRELDLCADPGNVELLYELAELALASGELETAAARLVQIHELDPHHAESHFAYGKICLQLGQPTQALTCFEAAGSITEGDPDLPGFELAVGEALLLLGRFAEAREHLEIAIESDPGQPAALMLLGTCLLAMGKPGDAADTFRRVLALDADNPVAHHRLGVCLFQVEHYAAGLEHCLHAIRAKPDYGAAMYTAILGHLHLARWGEARSMLRRALRNEPDNPDLQALGKRLWRYRLRHHLLRLLGPFGRVFGRRGGSDQS